MSDTPLTDKAVLESIEAVVRFGIKGGEAVVEQQLVTANFARKLERDIYEAEREIKDLTIRAQLAEKERNEALAQMCELCGRLSNIAEDAEAWLNSENDLPSVEMIKAIRDYAKESIK